MDLFKEFGVTRMVEAWGDDVPEGEERYKLPAKFQISARFLPVSPARLGALRHMYGRHARMSASSTQPATVSRNR